MKCCKLDLRGEEGTVRLGSNKVLNQVPCESQCLNDANTCLNCVKSDQGVILEVLLGPSCVWSIPGMIFRKNWKEIMISGCASLPGLISLFLPCKGQFRVRG